MLQTIQTYRKHEGIFITLIPDSLPSSVSMATSRSMTSVLSPAISWSMRISSPGVSIIMYWAAGLCDERVTSICCWLSACCVIEVSSESPDACVSGESSCWSICIRLHKKWINMLLSSTGTTTTTTTTTKICYTYIHAQTHMHAHT